MSDEEIQGGQIRWVAIRNLREDPEHAYGNGKPRPAFIISSANKLGLWLVAGVTTSSTHADGSERVRIPPDEWDDRFAMRPSYIWGATPALVPSSDVLKLIGLPSAQLRWFVAKHTRLEHRIKTDFLRLKPWERP